jgi:hypothetical protein
MRWKYLTFLFLAWLPLLATSQQDGEPKGAMRTFKAGSISALATEIMRLHNSDEERFRAAAQWVATNLSYDIRQVNSQTKNLTQAQITALAFKTRKAVCEGYAGLLDSLSRFMGLRTHLVSGYTRIEGQLDPTAHVWVAVSLSGNWKLSDPTFASGAMINNRFVAEYNPAFVMVKPEKMIRSHMPYDPLWQFLSSPLTHSGFQRQKFDEVQVGYFKAHTDSLKAFLQLGHDNQYRAELRRLEAQNNRYQAVVERMNFLIENINIAHYNEMVQLLNHISDKFNEAVGAYNNWASAFNENQRKGRRQLNTDELTKAERLLDECEKMLLSGRYPPQLIDQAQKIQQSVFDFQRKLRDAQ